MLFAFERHVVDRRAKGLLHLRHQFLKTGLGKVEQRDEGQRFYQASDQLKADSIQDVPLLLSHLRDDHSAWLGP